MLIHINLLSHQLVPNVLPVLAQRNQVSKVYIIQAGRVLEHKAQLLTEFYLRNGITETEIVTVSDPNDFYELRNKARELFKDIRTFYPDNQIVLNATCGTKPMSLAFCLEFNKPPESIAIYTDSFRKRTVVLNDSDKIKDLPYPNVEQFTITDYLLLNGFVVDTMAEENEYLTGKLINARSELTKQIWKSTQGRKHLITKLNAICQQTYFNDADTFIPSVNLERSRDDSFDELLERLQQSELVVKDGQQLQFADQKSARYLGGGWFEELCYLAAKEAQIEHVAMQVVGHQINTVRSTAEVKNELDIVLMQNCQMLIIEAKTVNWRKSTSNSSYRGQVEVLKLDSLTNQYGGDFAKGMLVSVFEFGLHMQARLRNIEKLTPFHVNSYQSLVNRLLEWKKKCG